MSDKERLRKALDSMIYLPHLKDRQARSAVAALLPGDGPPGTTGRPWDRGDLFHRLQTFRAATWFAKPAVIGAVECARRGWRNAELDLLVCESCKAAVSCPIAPELMPPEAQRAAERYARQLTDAHKEGCPWRAAACSLSLLQFPELPRVAVLSDFNDRAAALQRLLCLPPIAPEALAELQGGWPPPPPPPPQRLEQLLRLGPQQPVDPEAQQAAAAGAGHAAAAQETQTALCEGTATCDADSFMLRVRLVALCGWDLRVMSTAGAGRDQLPAHVAPECAVLSCTLCGARAGLWSSFPSCQAQVLGGASRRGAQTAGASAGRSPGTARALARNVAVNMGTTIAGGAMEASAAVAGPFGAEPPAGGQASQQGGHGTTAGVAPAGASSTAAESTAAPFGSAAQVDGGVGAGAGAGGATPVFGFAALRAAEPAADEGAAGGSGGAKRARGALGDAAEAAEASGPADKRAKAALDNGRAAAVTAVAQYPSPAVLLRYRSMPSLPLHPLALHRAFCPWARSPRVGGDEGGECGWQWCLKQLAPGGSGRVALLRREEDGSSSPPREEDGGPRGAVWDPAAMLRRALSKVEVEK